MGGVRLYPSCPICLQRGCLDCLGNEASKKDSCTFQAPRKGAAKRRPLPPIPIQVARGRLSKQIAHDIGIAEATVKVHRSRAMQKMKAGSLPELGRMADKLKLIPNKPQHS